MSISATDAAQAGLTPEEWEILDTRITRLQMKLDIERYCKLSSRHVNHDGNNYAVLLLLLDLFEIGRGRLWLRPQLFSMDKGEDGPQRLNVEAMLPGVNSSEVIVIGAHLDSTAERDPSYSPTDDPAPGADDDASGIGGVLAAARAIVALQAAQPPGQSRAEIRFTLFNAEEQGQRGSREHARREKRRGTRITAMYQMDMIGYRQGKSDEFELHAGFKRNSNVQAASLELADHLAMICKDGNLPLTPQIFAEKKRDPGQGFSDHTSFHRKGYPAVLVTENFFPGPDGSAEAPNPDYHLPEDLPRNLDPSYAATIARAVAAAAWHRATRLAPEPSPSSAGSCPCASRPAPAPVVQRRGVEEEPAPAAEPRQDTDAQHVHHG